MFKQKKGFTLVETMIAISVSLLLIAFIFIIYKKVQDNEKTNTEIQEILTIKGMIDSAFAFSSSYQNISVNMFSFPDNMYDPNSYTTMSNGKKEYFVFNSWKGRVIIGNYGGNVDNYTTYYISYYNVPIDACYKMVTYFSNIKLFATMGVYEDGAHTLTYDKQNIDKLCSQQNFNDSKGLMLFSNWGSNRNL